MQIGRENAGIILAVLMITIVVILVSAEFAGLGSLRPAHASSLIAGACSLLLGRFVYNTKVNSNSGGSPNIKPPQSNLNEVQSQRPAEYQPSQPSDRSARRVRRRR